ncbi:MAG: T9SS type A sorting domain-containing protein [Acidobacteriota bacterium]
MKYTGIVLLALLFASTVDAQTTLQQRLVVTQNAKTVGGAFSVGVYVSGTNLPAANTLGSMTIDIAYNDAVLTFTGATQWGFGSTDGYSRFANGAALQNIIRIGVTSMGVNGDGNGTPAGFDITAAERLIVQLNFTIKNTMGNANLSIQSGTNQIGLFANHANQPNTGQITNQPLAAPVVVSDEPLPVELASFNAETTRGAVCLSWKTATELSNLGFDIERKVSYPGARDAAWSKIGFVSGAGTSNAVHEYTYTDTKPAAAGIVSYRLKQIDRDGAYTYSKEIEMKAEAPAAYALSQNYPNPFNPSTTIYFETPKEGMVTISVFNVLGEKIADAVHAFYQAGRHAVTFRADAMSSGIYFYRLSVNGMAMTKTMHLLK